MKYYLVSSASTTLGALTDDDHAWYSNENTMMRQLQDGEYVYEIHVGPRRLATVTRNVELLSS